MPNVDWEAIGIMVVGLVLSNTKTQVNNGVDAAANRIVAAVKNSETAIDDKLVKDGVAPALRRLADQLEAGLA